MGHIDEWAKFSLHQKAGRVVEISILSSDPQISPDPDQDP